MDSGKNKAKYKRMFYKLNKNVESSDNDTTKVIETIEHETIPTTRPETSNNVVQIMDMNARLSEKVIDNLEEIEMVEDIESIHEGETSFDTHLIDSFIDFFEEDNSELLQDSDSEVSIYVEYE